MSLLMDALRKAEAEKEQAARDAATASSTSAPAAAEPPPTPASSSVLSHDDPTLSGEFPVDSGAALSLEPIEPASPAAPDPTATMPPAAAEAAPRRPLVDERRPLPRTAAERRAYGSTEPGTEPLPPDVPPVARTIVNADTVFEAGKVRRTRAPLIVVAAVAALTAGGLIAGVLYIQQMTAPHAVPTPAVAAAAERDLARTAPVVPAPIEPPPVPAPVPVADPSLQTVRDISPEPTAAPLPSASVEPLESSPGNDAPAAAAPVQMVSPEPAVAAAEPPSAAGYELPEIGLRPGEMNITRNSTGIDTQPLLTTALRAFERGDYAVAREHYQRVFAAQPRNRDALLGLGAVAMRGGDLAAAHRSYRQVLKLEPGNANALAALFVIEGGAGEQATESRLKGLLETAVDRGYVQFALGNYYLRQRRWPDAQQAFFAAVSEDSRNPDYAYNLAVSLDHMGQRRAALDYYRKALTLADGRDPGFATDAVLARIQQLTAAP